MLAVDRVAQEAQRVPTFCRNGYVADLNFHVEWPLM